jgi:hypothetical protein
LLSSMLWSPKTASLAGEGLGSRRANRDYNLEDWAGEEGDHMINDHEAEVG